jgi:hypothetical protein
MPMVDKRVFVNGCEKREREQVIDRTACFLIETVEICALYLYTIPPIQQAESKTEEYTRK